MPPRAATYCSGLAAPGCLFRRPFRHPAISNLRLVLVQPPVTLPHGSLIILKRPPSNNTSFALYMNLSFPILSPIPPPDKYHHDYSDLRSPILTQSVLSPIYTIVQSPEFFSDFARTILPFFHLIPWIMAALLGGGDEALGQLGQFPLEQWFFEMPPCTRYWTTATVITSILLQCKVITPFQLFYSFRAVYYKSQVSGPLHTPLEKHITDCTSTGDY